MNDTPSSPGRDAAPRYQCPECGYDVSRTLADAIETCPECGRTITYEMCRSESRRGSVWGRGALLVGPGVVWASLLAGLFVARVPMAGQVFGVLWLISAALVFRRVCAVEAAKGQRIVDRRTRAMGVIVINILVSVVVLAVLFPALGRAT